MKRLVAIIGILLVIFVGMYIYTSNINKKNVNATEVEEIQSYISKIYMWQEITEVALPKFSNINEAPDLWVWEVVKKNLENYELSYDEIQEKSIEIFGDNFEKQFPKNGSEYIHYNEELEKYISTGIGLDPLDDLFYIKNIKKMKKGYKVEIIEYLEDYENAMNTDNDEEIYDIYIKNLEEEVVATLKSNESETKAIETVKKNINKFSKKIVNLIKSEDGKIYVDSVE